MDGVEETDVWGPQEAAVGSSAPLGATPSAGGCNFALFAPSANAIDLLLYHPASSEPFARQPLNRSGDVWHVWLSGILGEARYVYLVDGVELFDPYARQLDGGRGVLLDPTTFDWQGVSSPARRMEDLVIYEMHVRAFGGTFQGVIERIPYLRSLGINAVELLPVFEFDSECSPSNFWGYASQSFFAPKSQYGSAADFKTLVRELHRAGIEVILDVVYNHTGGAPCPLFTLDPSTYYILDDHGGFTNYSGCGNTLNSNHPVVKSLILDSLRYWAGEMGVDGFRFDLASTLTRNGQGHPMERPPLLEAIGADPLLSNVKLIAEPWDAAGLYQVGRFPSWGPWSEWNGPFRDVVRRFIKGTDGQAGEFASRLAGSRDLYGASGRPASSINFVTCHDGFSLRDLVSYNHKHNEANGEENRDGSDWNESWNCGVEGETDDPHVLALRDRQMRNLMVALMVSQGVPMVLMGDEYGRTAHGNNNTWCQDNELTHFDWEGPDRAGEWFDFVRELIALRKAHPELRMSDFPTPEEIQWHGHLPHSPDWSDRSRFVAFTVGSLYIAFNAHYEPAQITLPPGNWEVVIDTGCSYKKGRHLTTCEMAARSAYVLKTD